MSKTQPALARRPVKLKVLLAFTLVATLGFRLQLLANKNSISHDEAITYLSATCHQGEFSRFQFDAKPLPAATWKGMLQVEDRLCFAQISADLGRHDIHPPLYFWLLHIFSLATGVGVLTGPALNTIMAMLSTILLYQFARSILNRRSEAILVTFSYAFNVAVTTVSGLARQYDLLILITVLVCWSTVGYTRTRRRNWQAPLSLLLLSMLGGLTHYHFALPLSACTAYLFFKLRTAGIRVLAIPVASLALGFAISLLLHPYLLSSLETELGFFGALTFGADILYLRLLKLGVSIASYAYLIILMLLLIFWSSIRQVSGPERVRTRLANMDWSGAETLYFAFWLAGGTMLLYLSSVTPLHQMSPKYFAMAWPFLSFVPVFVLRFAQERASVRLYLYLFPLALSLAFASQQTAHLNGNPAPLETLRSATMVLVDNVARGIFPRIVWHLPDESTVIAATQHALLKEPDSWLALLDHEFLYISEVSYGSTTAGQAEIIGVLEEAGYMVTEKPGAVADAGTVYKATPERLAR